MCVMHTSHMFISVLMPVLYALASFKGFLEGFYSRSSLGSDSNPTDKTPKQAT